MAGNFDFNTDEIDVGTWNVGAIQAFSMGGWFKIDAHTITDSRILSKASGTASDNHDWMFGNVLNASVQRIRVRFKAGGTTDTFIGGTTTINTDQWYCVVVTYNGTNVVCYIDGSQEFSTAHSVGGNMDATAKQIYIGNNAGDNKAPDGAIAEMFVLSNVLTSEQAGALANGANIMQVNPVNVEGYWPLYMNNTTTVPDLSGNGRNGTVLTVTRRDHAPVGRYVSAPIFSFPLDKVGGSPPVTTTPIMIGGGIGFSSQIIG